MFKLNFIIYWKGAIILMKKIYLFSIFILMFLLSSCGNTFDDAIKTASEYKKIQFEVHDHNNLPSIEEIKEKLTPFLKENFLETEIANRTIALSINVAKTKQVNINPEKIEFKVNDKSKNDVEIELTYSMNLVLTDVKNSKSKIKLEGTMDLEKINDQWRIRYDNYNKEELLKLVDQ